MSLISMLMNGPKLTSTVKPHVYAASVVAEWSEVYRCIGVSERTTAEIVVKMDRVRNGKPPVNASSLHRRLRKMETLGFVSHREVCVEYSTKPVMVWQRETKPCP